jgi:hypothetical protein
MNSTYIFPSKCGFAAFTEYICHSMQSCQQHPLLCRATPNVYTKNITVKLPLPVYIIQYEH